MSKSTITLGDHFTLKKLLKFVYPPIIMMIFTSIYGVVDGIFVSNYAGKTAFAAINLVMPFIMILGGMGFMVGTGGTALVSKIMGEGDMPKANRYFSMMIIFTAVLGLVLTALGIIFVRPVSILFRATEDMIGYCVEYGVIVIAFTVPFMLQNVFHSFLIAAEKPRFGLLVTVIAGVTNMVLDLVFVGIFKWGVAGAAVATGLSQVLGAAIPLVYFLRPNESPLRLKFTKPEFKPILQACWNGSSELMSNISSSIVGMLYNIQLMKYFGEDGVSAYGVLMYVNFIFVATFIGYSIGCAPIVGYNYGAQNHQEMHNVLKKSIYIMGITGVCMTILALTCSPVIAKIFVGAYPDLYDLTCKAFLYSAAAFTLAGFNIYMSSFFTALNNGGISAAISFMRTLIFQSASIILLPLIIGKDGIWLAITVAEVFAFILSLIFLLANRKKYNY